MNKFILSVRNGSSGKGNQSFFEPEQADCWSWGQVSPVYKSSIKQWDTRCLRGEYSKVKQEFVDKHKYVKKLLDSHTSNVILFIPF